MIPVLTGVRLFGETDGVSLPTMGPNHVTIDVKSVSLCGSDLRAYRGEHPNVEVPTILGHEFSGVIAEVGSDVEDLRVGDRVFGDPTSGCGVCRFCSGGKSNICDQYSVLGRDMTRPGALAGQVVLPADRVHRLPEGVTYAHGALIQPLSVGYHAVAHRSRPTVGGSALIAGSGAIGLGVLLAAKAAGLRVLVSEPSEWRRNLAVRLGADGVVDPSQTSVVEASRDFTDGYGVDTTFEAVGTKDGRLLSDLLTATASGGTVVVLGLKIDLSEVPVKQLKYLEKTVTGSQAHPGSLPAVADRIADGLYEVGPLVTHELGIDSVRLAFDILDRQTEDVVKIVIDTS